MGNFRRWAIIIALLVIAGCGFVGFRAIFGDNGDKVIVPQLVGMRVSEAADTLQKLGITAKTKKVESSEAADVVVSQDVKPGGKVSPGSSLLLQISRGNRQDKVPDVRFMKKEEAVRVLEEAGFRVEKTVQVPDVNRNEGTVLAQNPYAGQKYDTGGSVELLLSTGGKSDEGMVYVPDLRGKTGEEAAEMLHQRGLAVGEISQAVSSSKEGTVISTKPNIGARVKVGDAVSLVTAVAQETKKEPAVQETHTDENVVKAVKPEVKQPVQVKKETPPVKKAEVKQEVKKSDKKPETKAVETAKTAEKTKSAEKQKETKQTVKTEKKPETKAETKDAAQPKKAEAKAEAKPAEKTAEVKEETKPAEKKDEVKTETAAPKQEAPNKMTKVRYVVPPLTSPMQLKITVQDADGQRVLKDVSAKGNEVISLTVKYRDKATVTILLGGETVWQENCR